MVDDSRLRKKPLEALRSSESFCQASILIHMMAWMMCALLWASLLSLLLTMLSALMLGLVDVLYDAGRHLAGDMDFRQSPFTNGSTCRILCGQYCLEY
jgi:hypothetical protein